MELEGNQSLENALVLTNLINSISEEFKNPTAKGMLKLMVKKLERAIFEEFGVTPEEQRILKDKILHIQYSFTL
jgi:hypothetical protein